MCCSSWRVFSVKCHTRAERKIRQRDEKTIVIAVCVCVRFKGAPEAQNVN